VGQRYFALGGFDTRPLDLKLNVPAASVGDSSAFRHAQGRIVLTPVIGNNGTTLSVPYYMVARARSDVRAEVTGDPRRGTGTLWLDNRSGTVTGTGDCYVWGLQGTHSELGSIGIRSVGVKAVSDASGTRVLAFAVKLFGRVSHHSTRDVYLDVDSDGDGVADYLIVAADLGLLTGEPVNGQIATAVFDLVRGGGVFEFYAKAANDGATMILPVVAAHVGVTAANPRFSYVAQIYDGRSHESDSITTPASFNAFSSAISNGAFATVPGGQRVSVPVSVDDKELALTPALGMMVVANENSTKGNRQALLLPVKD
jgi:hypothetical protein